MTATHTLTTCPATHCPWEADGPNARTQADEHTAHRGPAHQTITRTHPTTHCAKEGCR